MIIKTQITSDNNVRNFYLPQKFFDLEASVFVDAKSLRKSPLAEAIFDIGDIDSILIAPDMVSVTKKNAADWDDLNPQIMAEILDFIATGAAAVVIQDEEETTEELMRKISSLVAARIRPALNKDGGDIELKGFENGVLWVALTGKCVGCPYASRTLKEGVEKILKNYIPQINQVKPIDKDIK